MDANNIKKVSHFELPSSLGSSRHTIVEVVLLIAVIGLFYWFIVQPKRAIHKVQNGQLAALSQEFDSLKKDAQDLQRLVAAMKNHPQEIAKLDEALPLEGKSYKLDVLIDKLAQLSGVTLGSVSVTGKIDGVIAGNQTMIAQPFSVKRSLRKMSASVNVSGTYDQLKIFLRGVENNSRIMDVRTLGLSSAAEGKLNLKLELEAYSYE